MGVFNFTNVTKSRDASQMIYWHVNEWLHGLDINRIVFYVLYLNLTVSVWIQIFM